MKKEKYLLVDSSILPDIYHKVIEAKRLLNSGKCSCVSDAVKRTGISRSAYYKYKDYVFPFYEMSKEKILTCTEREILIPEHVQEYIHPIS